jgi:hypothetical protein
MLLHMADVWESLAADRENYLARKARVEALAYLSEERR